MGGKAVRAAAEAALGVAQERRSGWSLPGNIAVEIEAIFELEG
jgi:hypothetical protein